MLSYCLSPTEAPLVQLTQARERSLGESPVDAHSCVAGGLNVQPSPSGSRLDMLLCKGAVLARVWTQLQDLLEAVGIERLPDGRAGVFSQG